MAAAPLRHPDRASSRSAPTRRLLDLRRSPATSRWGSPAANTSSSTPAWSPPTGKAVKRAYSILSADADQRRFTLATQAHRRRARARATCTSWRPATEIKFSGPWGKLPPAPEALAGRRPGAGHRHRHDRRAGAGAGRALRAAAAAHPLRLAAHRPRLLPARGASCGPACRAGLGGCEIGAAAAHRPPRAGGPRARAGWPPSWRPAAGAGLHRRRRRGQLRAARRPAWPPASPPPGTASRASSTCPKKVRQTAGWCTPMRHSVDVERPTPEERKRLRTGFTTGACAAAAAKAATRGLADRRAC